jgi:hypothetical protein
LRSCGRGVRIWRGGIAGGGEVGGGCSLLTMTCLMLSFGVVEEGWMMKGKGK